MTEVDHSQVNQMLAESRKKSTQIITAGFFAVIILGFGIWGAVKFYPISSQLTRLVDTVDTLESDAQRYSPVSSKVETLTLEMQRLADALDALSARVKSDEEVDEKFRLTDFPNRMQTVNSHLAELRDIAGDAAGDLERLQIEVKKNIQDHVDQKHRANTRAGLRLVRDGNIAHNTGRIDELEKIAQTMLSVAQDQSILDTILINLKEDVADIDKWRSTLQVGREEILEGQIRALQSEISIIKAQLGKGATQ